MKRVEVELKVKMILDVNNDQDLDNIKDDICFTDIEVDDGMKILSLKIVDSKVKEII